MNPFAAKSMYQDEPAQSGPLKLSTGLARQYLSHGILAGCGS
jgi:hypothetical protein